MTSEEDWTYYVYGHVDPETGELVYIGKGKHGRAWDVTRARGQHKEHQQWMIALTKKGYIPSDWVVIYNRGLTEKAAFEVETKRLHSNGTTRFNRQGGERNHRAKLTDEQAKEIFIRCVFNKEKHKDVADEFGVCRSAVSLIATRKQWKTVTAGLTNE